MAARELQWGDLEEEVASVVRRRYEELADTGARRRFLQEIQRADWDLRLLARGIDLNRPAPEVNYATSRMGEAYALRYHLPHADNAAVLMDEFSFLARATGAGYFRRLGYLLGQWLPIRRLHRADRRVRMLDIGAGTGAGAMALWFDAHAFRVSYGVTDLQVTAVGVEPAKPMRAMADDILGVLQERLADAEGLDAETARAVYAWEYAPADNLQELYRLPVERNFDLILFSYTFGPEHIKNSEHTLADVRGIAGRLHCGGSLLFLTPKRPVEKIKLMERIAQTLRDAGMRHRISRLSGYRPHSWWRVSSLSPQRYPSRVTEARRFFEQECQEVGMASGYGENPRPYYGLYARCDVFARRE
jgi:SAM-dependent methyltransferase